jgi:UDP-glucose 4-epimerase
VQSCLPGVQVVFHAATLHKPHVATHSRQHFIDTNITGTLHLLEEAVTAGVETFVFIRVQPASLARRWRRQRELLLLG